jgi:hypothetical protein
MKCEAYFIGVKYRQISLPDEISVERAQRTCAPLEHFIGAQRIYPGLTRSQSLLVKFPRLAFSQTALLGAKTSL